MDFFTLSILDSFKRIIDVWASRSKIVLKAFLEHNSCGLNISSKNRSLNMLDTISCMTKIWNNEIDRLLLSWFKKKCYSFFLCQLGSFGRINADPARKASRRPNSKKAIPKLYPTFLVIVLRLKVFLLFSH